MEKIQLNIFKQIQNDSFKALNVMQNKMTQKLIQQTNLNTKFNSNSYLLSDYKVQKPQILIIIITFQQRKTLMGAVLTCLAGGVCCCFGICCNQVVDALTKLFGAQRLTKIYYLVLVLIFVVPAIFVFFFLYNWEAFKNYFGKWFHCPNDQGFECIGASAIYRLSLSLLCLFLLMTLLMLCRNKCAQVVNEGLFLFRYLLVLGASIGFLWVNNSVFQSYAIAAKYISIAYMVLQSIILIDLFYMLNIKWVKKYNQGQNCYAGLLIFWTILFEAGAVFLNVYGYVLFSGTDDGSCTSLTWVNIITSVIIVVLPLFQICQWNQQNSLLTSSLVSLYISYLSFIAQFSYDGLCSRITKASLAVDITVSTLIFILSMYGSIMGGSGQVRVTANGDINKAMGVAPHSDRQIQYADGDNNLQKNPQTQLQLNDNIKRNNQPEDQQISEEQKYTHTWDWVKWHFYMSLASIYVAVLITNWNSANVITTELSTSGFSFWVRVIIAWVTTVIYIWTIVAPKVIPSRDFRVQ